MAEVVAIIGHNRLDYIKRRIVEGHDRATKGGAEWVEGSLQMAAALREGREAVPADISFSSWLAKNGLAFFNKNARAALIHLAEDIDTARAVLTETDSVSYEMIWAKYKGRFPSARKPRPPSNRKPRSVQGSAMVFRAMKLGEETMARIRGTSLDSAAEMDELIMLNRGAPEGGQTAIVKQLIDDAVAGKAVSAIADGRRMTTRKAPPPDLHAAWLRRMVAAWKLAKQEERTKLLITLCDDLDEVHRTKVAEALLARM